MEKKTYTGGCHCGKFRYEVETDLAKVIECNCSHCYMKGLLLAFVKPEEFRLTAGSEDELTDYLFNKKTIHHFFCPVCGVESFGRGQNRAGEALYAINVRCLDGVEPESLELTPVNGKEY